MAFAVYPQLAIPHNRQYADEQGFSLPYTDAAYRESQVNCGAAGGAAQANFGHAQPKLVTHHDLRLAAGNPKTPGGAPSGLSTYGIEAALKHFGCDAQRHQGPIGGAVDALMAGYVVGFAVDYPTINAFRNGMYSGDRRFSGPHYLVCKGWRRNGGTNQTGDWDSILDGRPKAYTILNAPVWVPFRMVRLAAGNFRLGGATYPAGTPIGANQAIFVTCKPA